MAGLLTATSIWKNFILDKNVEGEVIAERVDGDFSVCELNVLGRNVSGERVIIFAELVRLTRTKHAPVVIIAKDAFDTNNNVLAYNLAKKGFIAITVDYAGEYDGKEKFTRYPEKVAYANLKNVDLNTFVIKEDYTTSNWFEWDCVLKCVFYYAQNQEYANGVGFLGINDGATVVMHVLATEENVKAGVIVGGTGWQAYREIDKYGETPEPHFDDETLRYVASVESETYSQWIKCPLLALIPSNSKKYDCDRAYDTISRIDENVYTAFNIAPLRRDSVDYQSYFNAETFLSKFLLAKNSKTVLPGEVSIKAEVENAQITISVSPDMANLKEVELFVSEEVCASHQRSWKKRSKLIRTTGDTYEFSYSPYGKSKRVFFFARATYKNKFSVCSPITSIKFEETDVAFKNKSVILYSTRVQDGETAFCTFRENVSGVIGVSLIETEEVSVSPAIDETEGLTSKNGLITYRLKAQKYRPKEDALLMFDVFSKTSGVIKVSLHAEISKTEVLYTANVKVLENVWQNVKLYKNSFKTKDGAPIKDFSNVFALSMCSENDETEFLINNALWV